MTLHPKTNQQFYSSLSHYSLFCYHQNDQIALKNPDYDQRQDYINIETQMKKQPCFLNSKGAFTNLLYLLMMDITFLGTIITVYFLQYKQANQKGHIKVINFQAINFLIAIIFLSILNLSFILVQFKNPSIPNLSLYIPLLQNQEITKLFCFDCGYYLPQSSNIKHCKSCNTCVRQFDHHCGFFDRCIGKGNLRWFYTFELSLLLEIASLVVMLIKLLL